jgi:hypothetical protein
LLKKHPLDRRRERLRLVRKQLGTNAVTVLLTRRPQGNKERIFFFEKKKQKTFIPFGRFHDEG